MKRNDLKEISDNEFVAVLGMMRLESFLDGWERYDLSDVFPDDSCDYARKEGVFDVVGWEKYLVDFRVDMYLKHIDIEAIELFDLQENQINLSKEQRLKMATIIQERLTLKN